MMPAICTAIIPAMSNKESIMQAQTGRRLTAGITAHELDTLKLATITLTRRESSRLLELLDAPPPRNEKFVQAQARYQRTKADAGPAI
jgi:hypothetical protein